jgi:hypothetical protein
MDTEGGTRPSQSARTANTLRLRQLMDETQRLEIAERIHQLQERCPWTEPVVADRLGLTLRGYQKMEQKGTTKWERAEELAKIHAEWARDDPEWIGRATAGWIWDGRERPVETPDLLGELERPTELAALRAAVEDLRKELRAMQSELLAEIGKVRKAQEAQQSTPRRASRSAAAKKR